VHYRSLFEGREPILEKKLPGFIENQDHSNEES